MTAARDGGGGSIPFFQSGGEVLVFLDSAPPAGEPIEVELEYHGLAFESVESGLARSFDLLDTLYWYPHAGEEDLATYEVTLRWPKKWQLLAAGTLTGEGTEGPTRWQARTVTRPTKGFTFQFGNYETMTRQLAGVRLTLALDAISRGELRGQEELFDWIADAVEFLTGVFGPLPVEELTVATNQQYFSQAMLGFVTLSMEMMRDDTWSALGGSVDPRTIIAHEIAHQWWGHVVPWSSYRDQWLSEALANYSASLYGRQRLQHRAQTWAGPTSGWQDDLLLATATTGDRIESVGPVVLGMRLSSSISLEAYEAIVYKKGALVLNLLANLIMADNFHKILRWIAQESGVRTLSTEDLLQVVAKATQVDLAPFASSFIYGTGVPEVEYSYRAEPSADGAWRLMVSLTYRSQLRYRYRIAETHEQGHDVVREIVAEAPLAPAVELIVPLEVSLRQTETGRAGAKKKGKDRDSAAADHPAGRTGFLRLASTEPTVEFAVPEEPGKLTIDPDETVLGRFIDVTRPTKATWWRRAQAAASAGDLEVASSYFRKALATTAPAPGPAAEENDEGGEGEDLPGEYWDVAAHLELARLALDRGTDDEAASRLESARASMKKLDLAYRWYLDSATELVQCRFDLRHGDSRSVAKRLERLWDAGALADAEGLLLLAVAAKATGDSDLFERALEAAEERRAEVGDLASLRAPAR